MGLDPGLDHLSAASLINKLVSNKHKLLSFSSMCGGLPSPEDACDVPLKYKFSWRPQGVLVAALQDAFYVLLGEVFFFPSLLVRWFVERRFSFMKSTTKSVETNC
jgi:alpha-aminoadipic semialdehyde synthase